MFQWSVVLTSFFRLHAFFRAHSRTIYSVICTFVSAFGQLIIIISPICVISSFSCEKFHLTLQNTCENLIYSFVKINYCDIIFVFIYVSWTRARNKKYTFRNVFITTCLETVLSAINVYREHWHLKYNRLVKLIQIYLGSNISLIFIKNYNHLNQKQLSNRKSKFYIQYQNYT